MGDAFASNNTGLSSPAVGAAAVAPNDTTDLPTTSRALYVGGTGNITVTMADGGANVQFNLVPAGVVLPIRAKRVLATGTTATLITAMY